MTPIEAADTPTIDRLADFGRVGSVATTPRDLVPLPVVQLATLLGVEADEISRCMTGGSAWPSVPERFQVSAAIATANDDTAACASELGFRVQRVMETATAACALLDEHDLVCVHAQVTAETPRAKRDSLEAIDAELVAPVARKLEDCETWRLLLTTDAVVRCEGQTREALPVPFLMAGSWVRRVVRRRWSEVEADASDLHVDPGCELMDYFLNAGVVSRRSVRR